MTNIIAYCLSEKKKAPMKDAKFSLNKIGRPVAEGKCGSCGGKMYKILAAAEVPADLKAKAAAAPKVKITRKSKKSKKSTKHGAAQRKSSKKSSRRKSSRRK